MGKRESTKKRKIFGLVWFDLVWFGLVFFFFFFSSCFVWFGFGCFAWFCFVLVGLLVLGPVHFSTPQKTSHNDNKMLQHLII